MGFVVLAKTQKEVFQEVQAHFANLPWGQSFVADGRESQGGKKDCTTNGPHRIYGSLVDEENDPDTVYANAFRRAERVVRDHNLTDGNGRTALYSMYFYLANKGYILNLEPKFLHAAWLGEDNGIAHPDISSLIQCFSKYNGNSVDCKNKLSSVQGQLKDLQGDREALKGRWRKYLEVKKPECQEKYKLECVSEFDVIVALMPGKDVADLDFWNRMLCYRVPPPESNLEVGQGLSPEDEDYDVRLEPSYARERKEDEQYRAKWKKFMGTLQPRALKDRHVDYWGF